MTFQLYKIHWGKLVKNFYKENDRESRSEWRKNISESHKGKILSDKTKLKLSKHNSKLTDNEVLEIIDLINSGKTYKFISEKKIFTQIEKVTLFETLENSTAIDFITYEKLHKKELKQSVITPKNEFYLDCIEKENPLLIGARFYKYS